MRTVFLWRKRNLCRGIDSSGGAYLGTAAAFDAGVGIDVIDITLADSFNGAYGLTCAASHADVCNYVSHSGLMLCFVVNNYVSSDLGSANVLFFLRRTITSDAFCGQKFLKRLR